MKYVEKWNDFPENTGKIRNAFSVQQETLCDSAVTDETFCFFAVNGWEGQSHVIIWLGYTL